MSVGLALIARDEEKQLPGLLSSIAGAFDQVALLDTGSEDRTVEVFEKWASRERPPLGYVVDHFEWSNDFAAARNAADEMLDVDWLCWADCDDEIIGAGRLRQIARRADSAGVDKVLFGYRLVGGISGYRSRLIRKGTHRWTNPVHERHEWNGLRWSQVPPGVCCWQHRRHGGRSSSVDRNLRILRAWVHAEPACAEALWFAMRGEFNDGDEQRGLDYACRYLRLRQVRRRLGTARLVRARQMITRLELPGAGDLGVDLAALTYIDPAEFVATTADPELAELR